MAQGAAAPTAWPRRRRAPGKTTRATAARPTSARSTDAHPARARDDRPGRPDGGPGEEGEEDGAEREEALRARRQALPEEAIRGGGPGLRDRLRRGPAAGVPLHQGPGGTPG